MSSQNVASLTCRRCQATKDASDFFRPVSDKRKLGHICTLCRIDEIRYRKESQQKRHQGKTIENGCKVCSICRVSKPTTEYNKASSRKYGIECFCRECGKKRSEQRRLRLKADGTLNQEYRKHNMAKWKVPLDWYKNKHDEQKGMCAICLKKEIVTRNGQVRELCIDHDHATGVNRGLLCSKCNLGIGHLQDSPTLLEKAAVYLRKHGKV